MRRLFLLAPLLLALAACQTPAAPPEAAVPEEPARVVFFTADSAALDESALAVVRDAAAVAKADPRLPVQVLGFAGPAGSQDFNQVLSEARARRVAGQLVAEGVDRSRILIRPRGPVPFEMIPTESRRVEIRIGG